VTCELDHLVIACQDLAQGAAWVAERLGAEPKGGGRHPLMGTHNRVLRIGARTYLEVIAIDPEAPAPARPRWFDLDSPGMQARLAESPALITWAVRTDSIAGAVAQVPELGEVQAVSRGALSWQVTIPRDGKLQFGGLLPAVLQWGEVHPTDTMEADGCELLALSLSQSLAPGVAPLLRRLRIAGTVDLKSGPRPLVARMRTRKGEVELS
jgi:hypothetical protein